MNTIATHSGRLIAIDYGTKRTGLSHTDPEKIIASNLATVATHTVIDFLKTYENDCPIEGFIVGAPLQKDGSPSAIEPHIQKFIRSLQLHFPQTPVVRYDERFTSKLAFQSLLDAGTPKKKRQDKSLVDQISATLILQSYLEAKTRQT